MEIYQIHLKFASIFWAPCRGSFFNRRWQKYFEYTPGVLRAYVKPKHLDALSFTLQRVIEAVSFLHDSHDETDHELSLL